MDKLYITRIWLDGHHLYAMTESGEIADYDLSTMRGFRHASPSQLGNFTVVNDKDIHWPDLGEDINLEGMLYDNHLCLLTATEDSVLYRPEPQSHDCVADPIGSADPATSTSMNS
ncbi:MAG: DUF2442 domain-containing protein [Prevotella sp.]|jgi:hypothetical protein|uniref:DUF2442 domain-containing protein n=1 Tax=Hallella mizrahii TaxID=2606637 RepID=A0A7K0KEU0_9BACT|nr:MULTISPECIES: DUF2442 domain-containing protein [Hallella]MCH3982220.1 DUF2442 domain-containing protein [Prevotella sp.]MCI2080145.1 DUF2442 domain-containing protein [Prevotella sp.]MCI2102042.1 DUF2442 domain-containing protein [Prevotella sp.]MDD5821043.1 DUF2442 domain-containing protein [Prevotella sp.]MST83985.1 DUF2442 domain-containing protein [Hallella mizrahii]